MVLHLIKVYMTNYKNSMHRRHYTYTVERYLERYRLPKGLIPDHIPDLYRTRSGLTKKGQVGIWCHVPRISSEICFAQAHNPYYEEC